MDTPTNQPIRQLARAEWYAKKSTREAAGKEGGREERRSFGLVCSVPSAILRPQGKSVNCQSCGVVPSLAQL